MACWGGEDTALGTCVQCVHAIIKRNRIDFGKNLVVGNDVIIAQRSE